jgi:hypothetical protein
MGEIFASLLQPDTITERRESATVSVPAAMAINLCVGCIGRLLSKHL